MATFGSMTKEFHAFIEGVLDRLLTAENRRMDTMIAELSYRNELRKGHIYYGFMYLGEMYVPEKYRGLAKASGIPPLDYSLDREGNALVTEHKRLLNDRQMIRQLLVKLLRDATTPQRIRDCLPDCLVQYTSVKDLPRFDSIEALIDHDKRLLSHYQKLLPKIEMYSVSAMLY